MEIRLKRNLKIGLLLAISLTGGVAYVRSDQKPVELTVSSIQSGAQTREALIGNQLRDLLTPIAPDMARGIVQGIQDALGINQVIAVPFFLNAAAAGGEGEAVEKEYVGSLFVAKRGMILDVTLSRENGVTGKARLGTLETHRRGGQNSRRPSG